MRHLRDWWEALIRPDAAGRLILNPTGRAGITPFLILVIFAGYGFYGCSMGVFRGWYPGLVAALKLPFLFFFTVIICYPPFYVLNVLHGPRLTLDQCLRLFLLAVSANTVAVASYTLFSFFFTLTTSRQGYSFLVIMHVIVFAVSGLLSLVEIGLIFRSAGRAVGRPIRPSILAAWGLLYAFVGSQMSWVLRPWIGSWSVPYQPFRAIGGSFIEAVWRLIF